MDLSGCACGVGMYVSMSALIVRVVWECVDECINCVCGGGMCRRVH